MGEKNLYIKNHSKLWKPFVCIYPKQAKIMKISSKLIRREKSGGLTTKFHFNQIVKKSINFNSDYSEFRQPMQ